MRKVHNLDITLTGPLADGNTTNETLAIPGNENVKSLLFTEIANANGRNYDIRLSDKTGIREDYTHRLQLNSVINGSTFVNCAFADREKPFAMEGGQNLKVDIQLLDALGAGETITLRVSAITDNC